jgi:hypothetical protein
MTASPSKRRRISELSMKLEAVDDWSDESPRRGMLFIGSGELNMQFIGLCHPNLPSRRCKPV